MIRQRRLLLEAAVVVTIIVLTAAILAPAFQGSNCGGNSAALAAVHLYLNLVQQAVVESPDHGFSITSATPEQREQLSYIADDFWTRPARFLVSAQPYREQLSGPRRVIIVCERPFRNVPRRILGQAPPTHAAAFSDGSIELISEAEFAALDRSTLVPLDRLLAGSKR